MNKNRIIKKGEKECKGSYSPFKGLIVPLNSLLNKNSPTP